MGSLCLKAVHKHVVEIDTDCRFYQHPASSFCANGFTPVLLVHTSWSTSCKNWALILLVLTGNVEGSVVGETDCGKLLVPAHLRFAPIGWWNWPQVSISSTLNARIFHTTIVSAAFFKLHVRWKTGEPEKRRSCVKFVRLTLLKLTKRETKVRVHEVAENLK